MSGDALVICTEATRTFGEGPAAVPALHPTTCVVEPGARIALMGPSGSGKSTLIHLMAGLDAPTTGSVRWPAIGSHEALRPGPVALVPQTPSLVPALDVSENVALPLVLGGLPFPEALRLARIALQLLELEGLADRLPEEISGGQAQRVAVARAVSGDPRLILADEPTGQLDPGTGAEVIDVLLAAADHAEAGLVVATHDPAVADRLGVCWAMLDGRLVATAPAP